MPAPGVNYMGGSRNNKILRKADPVARHQAEHFARARIHPYAAATLTRGGASVPQRGVVPRFDFKFAQSFNADAGLLAGAEQERRWKEDVAHDQDYRPAHRRALEKAEEAIDLTRIQDVDLSSRESVRRALLQCPDWAELSTPPRRFLPATPDTAVDIAPSPYSLHHMTVPLDSLGSDQQGGANDEWAFNSRGSSMAASPFQGAADKVATLRELTPEPVPERVAAPTGILEFPPALEPRSSCSPVLNSVTRQHHIQQAASSETLDITSRPTSQRDDGSDPTASPSTVNSASTIPTRRAHLQDRKDKLLAARAGPSRPPSQSFPVTSPLAADLYDFYSPIATQLRLSPLPHIRGPQIVDWIGPCCSMSRADKAELGFNFVNFRDDASFGVTALPSDFLGLGYCGVLLDEAIATDTAAEEQTVSIVGSLDQIMGRPEVSGESFGQGSDPIKLLDCGQPLDVSSDHPVELSSPPQSTPSRPSPTLTVGHLRPNLTNYPADPALRNSTTLFAADDMEGIED